MVPGRTGRNPIPKNLTIRRGQWTARRHLPGGNLGPQETGLGMARNQDRPMVSAAKGALAPRQVQTGSRKFRIVTTETFGRNQFGSPRLQVRRAGLRMRPARQRQARDGQEDDDGSVSAQERNLSAILHEPPIQSRSRGAAEFSIAVGIPLTSCPASRLCPSRHGRPRRTICRRAGDRCPLSRLP